MRPSEAWQDDEAQEAWWRGVRVRQRLLHDMTSRLNAACSWMVLIRVLHVMYVSALIYAICIGEFFKYDFDHDDPMAVAEVVISFVWMVITDFILVGLCLVAQWSEDEMETLVQDIKCQHLRFPILGMFFLGNSLMFGVLGTIATYTAVLIQLRA